MANVETVRESQINPSGKIDIYSRREALRTATLMGYLSGWGGVFITAPFLSFVGEDHMARVAFMSFNYFSFSTAAFISSFRSVRRVKSLNDSQKNTPLHE